MASVRLTERFAFAGGKVNREAGTIADCLISGLVSDNGRDYPVSTYRRDFAKYEGAPSNCDHGREDTIDRRLGWFTDVAPGPDGKPRGTYHLLKSHPMYERVMEAAEKNPRLFGFSHVIEAKTTRKNGREIVESIEKVISVDLVANPATTTSFFEGRTVGTFSLKQYVERFGPSWGPARWGAAKKLCEEFGDMAAAPVMDEPAADASPDEGDLKSALMAALTPFMEEAFDSGNSDKLCAACRDFVKMHAKHTGKGDAKDADTAGDKGEGYDKESKLVKAADVLAECAALQFSPSYEQGEHLRAIPDKGTRAVVIDSFKRLAEARPGEQPRSTGRAQVKEERKADGGSAPSIDELKKRWKS